MAKKGGGVLREKLGRVVEPHVLFPVFAVVIAVLIWGSTVYLIDVQRETMDESVRTTVRELTDTYEAQVLRSLREVDQALKLLQYIHRQEGVEIELAELELKRLLPPGYFFGISIYDLEGNLLDRNSSALGGEDPPRLEDVDREAPYDRLAIYLSAEGGAEGGPSLRFSRPLIGATGTPDGLAVVAVDPRYFVSGYEPESLGRQGLLGIFNSEGVFLAGRIGDRRLTGVTMDYDALEVDDSMDETSVLLAVTPVDGVDRYLGARELYQFPLAVVVGVALEEQQAALEEARDAYFVRAMGLTLILLVVIAVLWRMAHQLAVTRRHEMEVRIEHARQVEYLAYHDSLTGLPNRSLFSKLLGQNISLCQRYDRKLAVLFLDLDRFKHINDSLGHEVGDQLLQEVARRLRECLRQSDVVARMGGDEFVVMLPEVGEDAFVAGVARKMISAVSRPFELGRHGFRITVSIGIALCPDDGIDEQALTKNADVAMYFAKEQGRNNFQFYSEQLHSESLQQLTLETSLQHALMRNEFKLYFQAKRDVVTGDVSGMEALLRWEHPDLGIVAPMQFIPLAEKSGLMVPIGRWVLKAACEQNMAWQREGFPPMSMAVNLTAHQIMDPGLPGDIESILRQTGMSADLLELEISEVLFMRDVRQTLEVLNRLKAVGVRIVIDDFGVGYSSLAMLERFPLDAIKIDRSVIRDINRIDEHQALTKAILDMGRSLSLNVVAQGVETSEQADYLREHAFNELQGFFFDTPVPAADLTPMLKSQGKGSAGSGTEESKN